MKNLTILSAIIFLTSFNFINIEPKNDAICTPSVPSGIFISIPGGQNPSTCPNMSFNAFVAQNGADYYEWSISIDDANATYTTTATGTSVYVSVTVDEYPLFNDPSSYTQLLKVRACSNSPLCGCGDYKVKYVEIANGCTNLD